MYVYPPGTGMLGSDTFTISSAAYGNGVYTATASSEYGSSHCAGGYGEYAWQAFNYGGPFCGWTPAQVFPLMYCGTDRPGCSSGTYYGSVSTTISSSTVPGDAGSYPQTSLGEWVQLTMPAPIKVFAYTLWASSGTGRSPSQWTLVCQAQGSSSWVLLDSQNLGQSGWPWANTTRFPVDATTGLSTSTWSVAGQPTCLTFRIVLNKNSPSVPANCCDNGWIGLPHLSFLTH